MEKIENVQLGPIPCSYVMPRRIREDLRNIQLRIVRMDDTLWTNNTRQILINTMDEIAININESNQTNPRYNTNDAVFYRWVRPLRNKYGTEIIFRSRNLVLIL